jgi:hypothetical protein
MTRSDEPVLADPEADLRERVDTLERKLSSLRLALLVLTAGWGWSTINCANRPSNGFHDHSWLQHQIDETARRVYLHIHPEEITHQ